MKDTERQRFLNKLRFYSPGTQENFLLREKKELEDRLELINNILMEIQKDRNLGENDEKA